MRDMKADWDQWTPAERVVAISLIAAASLAYASSLLHALAG
jgi:hypothetical protein